MSDDEEVIIGKSDLYNHLIEHGYSGFESFTPAESQLLPKKSTVDCTQLVNCNSSSGSHLDLIASSNDNRIHNSLLPILNLTLSSYDYQKICHVLNSSLLLREDIDLVDTFISSFLVKQTTSKWYSFIGCVFGISGILACILLSKKPTFNVPIGVACILTSYTTWQSYKEIKAMGQNKLLQSHISTLQKLCLDVHKMLHFIKETEIISTEQLTLNVNAVVYNLFHSSQCEVEQQNLNKLTHWKTLPHLRRYLVEVLKQVICSLSLACDNLKGHCTQVDCTQSYSNININIESSPDIVHSVKDLQSLIDNYLALQSEYLRLVALSFTPYCVINTTRFKNRFEVEVYNNIASVQKAVNDYSQKLSLQYCIHNMPYSLSKPLYNGQYISSLHNKKSNKLQTEIHGVFLLVLSLLLRIRSLEDELVESEENSDDLNRHKNVIHQLTVLRNDFESALKCYDIIYRHIIAKNNPGITDQGSQDVNDEHINDGSSTPIRIEVGKSDFSLNVPDEVFLAVSGLKFEDQENNVDDYWGLDSKPQIPKKLLSELSENLKLRKKGFIEREKRALEKQGMQDFESLSDTSDSEKNYDNFQKNKRLRNKQGHSKRYNKNTQSESNDSGSERDSEVKVYHKITSDSDNSQSTSENPNFTDLYPCISSTSNIANLVAMKSKLWNNMHEDNFTDD